MLGLLFRLKSWTEIEIVFSTHRFSYLTIYAKENFLSLYFYVKIQSSGKTKYDVM